MTSPRSLSGGPAKVGASHNYRIKAEEHRIGVTLKGTNLEAFRRLQGRYPDASDAGLIKMALGALDLALLPEHQVPEHDSANVAPEGER
jgi:hypothetical protein